MVKKMNKKTLYKISSLLICACILSSCSVIMAGKKSGTSIEKVQNSRTRWQVLSKGATIVESQRLPTGELTELYRFKKEKGSNARAFMHAILDIGTCGLWEVVGTPVEVIIDDEVYYFVRVVYDSHDNIIRMELI
jgi:hypothetical protein